jgi:hypothetical protein
MVPLTESESLGFASGYCGATVTQTVDAACPSANRGTNISYWYYFISQYLIHIICFFKIIFFFTVSRLLLYLFPNNIFRPMDYYTDNSISIIFLFSILIIWIVAIPSSLFYYLFSAIIIICFDLVLFCIIFLPINYF